MVLACKLGSNFLIGGRSGEGGLPPHIHIHTTPSSSLTPAGCQEFNSVLTLSTQRGHQIAQAEGSAYKTAPHRNFRCQPQAQVVTSTPDQLAINQRLPPSLSSINLPEWFTELRETGPLLEDQFIVKGY